MLNLSAYLERIHYTGSTEPTADTLRALHRAHLLAVPFENLDIELGRKILCTEDAALHKIIDLHRGGFCYELNSAFAALLRALEFPVTLLSARVTRSDGSESPEFDHLAIRVDLDEPWLADVGFGDSFLEPLRLQAGIEQQQGRRAYRSLEESGEYHMERTDADGTWVRQYSFSLTPRRIEDFAGMCHFHQTSPQSHFTQNQICTRATGDGRITLSGWRLIITKNGKRTDADLESADKWQEALKQYFEIVL